MPFFPKFRFILPIFIILLTGGFLSAAPAVQNLYPAIAKVIGQGERVKTDEGESHAVYFGSGVYTAEAGELGIVLTNWHVVNGVVDHLEVRFPSFQSPAAVILADEVWDLAALAVRRPPFVPIPISLEVPQIGDELWVAGYGHASGLEGFQISSGPVLRYSVIDYSAFKWLKEPLPGETLMIGAGVRFGDSGGPILNRHGELAGLLWGSDGELTMGTFCLRVQAFLTQAQYQLGRLPNQASSFFQQAQQKKIPLKKISMASVPAQKALASSGVFPISSIPVYTTPKPLRTLRKLPDFYKPAAKTEIQAEAENNGTEKAPAASESAASANPDFAQKRNDYFEAHRSGFTLPPYPPMESPTVMVQRKTIGREHPEVYPNGMNRPATQEETAAASQSAPAADTAQTALSEEKPLEMAQTGNATLESSEPKSSDFQNVSSSEPGKSEPEKSPSPKNTESSEENAPAQTSPLAETSLTNENNTAEGTEEGTENGEKKGLKDRFPFLSKMPLSDIQTILVAAVILFLFVNSLRLLSIAAERQKSTGASKKADSSKSDSKNGGKK